MCATERSSHTRSRRQRSCLRVALKEKWEELQAFLKTKPPPQDIVHALQEYEDDKKLLEEWEREQKERAGEDRVFLIRVRFEETNLDYE